ncbi:MAG TPA: hemerythrin domain-containing protein [Pyrinomonadaceae bacterium]|nr:hemerythrin domain-containing protein [Pyrinomonadaceae bacterium]
MNAFQLLKEDHQKVSGLFQQVEPTTERAEKTRTELFAQIKQELDIHARIEETIFYPSIKKAAATREIVLEGFEEHHVIKLLLKELESMPVDTEEWAAKMKVLQENVEHHVEEEEGEMFQKARDVLSESEINQLGEQMQELKTQLKQQAKGTAANA